MAESEKGVVNVHLDAVEHEDTIRFMHTVETGAASKSYGLQVAQLAGVPRPVITAARAKLHELENREPGEAVSMQVQETPNASKGQSEMHFSDMPDPLRDALKQLSPDELSPREALDLIYTLKLSLIHI